MSSPKPCRRLSAKHIGAMPLFLPSPQYRRRWCTVAIKVSINRARVGNKKFHFSRYKETSMSKFLYVVTLNRGRSNPDHGAFLENVMRLNGKSPDYGGINNACVISHHMDADTVHLLCSDGVNDDGQITVEEITTASLNDPSSDHGLFASLVESYFLPYGKYKNLE